MAQYIMKSLKRKF